jgi:hypothetical protein
MALYISPVIWVSVVAKGDMIHISAVHYQKVKVNKERTLSKSEYLLFAVLKAIVQELDNC